MQRTETFNVFCPLTIENVSEMTKILDDLVNAAVSSHGWKIISVHDTPYQMSKTVLVSRVVVYQN